MGRGDAARRSIEDFLSGVGPVTCPAAGKYEAYIYKADAAFHSADDNDSESTMKAKD